MYIASAATTLKLHDFTTGEMVHNYQPGTNPDGSVRSVSWSKDGQWLLVVPYSGHAEVVSIRGHLKLLRTIEAVQQPTCACFQTSTKKNVAIGSKSGVTVVYNIKSKSAQKEFRGPSDEITHVRFTAQDSHCVAACKNGTVFVYNCVLNGKPRQLKVPKSKTITCLGTQPLKKNLVVGGSAEGMVVVWDLNINRSKFQTEAHQTAINCVSFSPNKSELISTAGQDRQCYFFDTNNGKHIANLSLQNSATSMDFSSDAKHFFLGHQNGHVSIYDLRNIKEPLRTFQAHNKSVKHLFCQPFSEQNSTESDISVEGTPIKPSKEDAIKPRFSDLFSCSLLSPDVLNTRISDAEGSPNVFSIDSHTNLSVNEKLSPQPSPVHDVGRLEIKVPQLQVQLFSSPKTTAGAMAVQSTSTQTDTFDRNTLEDFKHELRSLTADLHSTIENKSLEVVFELRDMICKSQFYTTKCLVKLMDSVDDIQTNISSLVEDNTQIKERMDILEDQLKNMHLI